MMMNTTPSVAEIDATMNLLSVLELAKDATKLKDALAQIKAAQAECADMQKSAEKALDDAKAKRQELDRLADQLDAERARAKEETSRALKASQDVQDQRDQMREDRDAFDRWMAEQREKLAADQARADSDRVANARRAEEIQAAERAAAAKVAEAELAIRTADAKRVEYEQKMAALKQMVS